MSAELFRSRDLLVRQIDGHGSAACVVTFDSFTDLRSLERTGFGEHFIDRCGIDALHVISRENDWYHYPEMIAAMAAVHQATRGYQRVVTFGSSMGAYAAIRFAGLAGAHVALALSPQYSIDPAVVPFETRWAECSRRFHGIWERTLPLPLLDEAFILYDPKHRRDNRHLQLLVKQFRCNTIRVPQAGHPVTGYLADVGLLQALVQEVSAGCFDKADFEDRARRLRAHSARPFVAMSDTMPRKRPRRRIALLRRAVRIAPDSAAALCRLGLALAGAGRFGESLALHRRAMDILPDHPDLRLQYSCSLEASGDIAAAIAVMEDLDAAAGGTPLYRSRLEALRALPPAVPTAAKSRWRERLRRLLPG